jgi:hypothetical protein
MTLTELIHSAQVQFLVDESGNKKAVLVDFSVWQEILAALEQKPDIRKSQSIRGKYAFVSTSSDEFARRKQVEIDMETAS